MNKITMFKKLGTELGKSSVYFLKRAFSIKPTTLGGSRLIEIVKDKTGIPTFTADRIHYFTDWETWRQLILYDWTDKKKYLVDKYDCDNFSSSFCSRMAEIYDLNTAGRLYCNVYDKDTGKKVAAHVAVLIVDKDNRVFLMESQNDKTMEITNQNQRLVLGQWRYRLNYVRFN